MHAANPASIQPSEIRLSADKSALTVSFGEVKHTFTAEFLRVTSPSAEVQGHGPGDLKTIGGKKNVTIKGIEPVGHYAVKLVFSDGHATGIYTWTYFADMGEKMTEKWQGYTNRLQQLGLTREG